MKVEFKSEGLGGFSLIEVVLSMGILAIAVIPILGLLPQSLKTIKVSSEEIQAGYLLEAVVEDLKNTPLSQSQSSLFKLDCPPSRSFNLLGKTQKIWIDSGWNILSTEKPPLVSCFQVELLYTQATEPYSLLPTEALVKIQWPPVLDDEKKDTTVRNNGGELSTRVLFSKSIRN